MADEFTGNPAPLRMEHFEEAAAFLGCSVAAVQAVAHVESAGSGFLPDGRPNILFERHIFHKLTGGRYSASFAQISSPRRGGYLGGRREYDRLRAAIALDRVSALQAASWGKFQIMGFNHRVCGYGDVESLVRAMVSGEPAQLATFVVYIKAHKLDDHLVRCDWAGFARGYNGSAYAENAYDHKIARAYARMAGPMPMLRLGCAGPHVRHLQTLLRLSPADGMFGGVTRMAVIALQQRVKLVADGIVGPDTWRALLS